MGYGAASTSAAAVTGGAAGAIIGARHGFASAKRYGIVGALFGTAMGMSHIGMVGAGHIPKYPPWDSGPRLPSNQGYK